MPLSGRALEYYEQMKGLPLSDDSTVDSRDVDALVEDIRTHAPDNPGYEETLARAQARAYYLKYTFPYLSSARDEGIPANSAGHVIKMASDIEAMKKDTSTVDALSTQTTAINAVAKAVADASDRAFEGTGSTGAIIDAYGEIAHADSQALYRLMRLGFTLVGVVGIGLLIEGLEWLLRVLR